MDVDLMLFVPLIEEMAARAEQVEHGGFDGLFVAESRHDPYLPLAVAAQHTAKTIGTAIALAFPRSPMATALAAWDLQRVSNGRFVLGLGAQVRKHIEQRFGVPYGKPAPRLREYTEAVRHIWGAFEGRHALDFHGPTYDLDFLPALTNPGPLATGAPPIYFGAVGPVMFQAAGAVADGAFVHPIHSLEYLAEVAAPALARGMEETGRRREDFTLSVMTIPLVEEAGNREAMRAQFAFYASTPAYKPVLERAGHGKLSDTLRVLSRQGDAQAMTRLIDDDVLEQFSVSGRTWSDAVAEAKRKYAGVADRIAFQAMIPVDVRLDQAVSTR